MWLELVEWADGQHRPHFIPAHKAPPLEVPIQLDPNPKEFPSRSTREPGTNAALVEAIRLTMGVVPTLRQRTHGEIQASANGLAGIGHTEREALCALLHFVAGKVGAAYVGPP
jgi:hypothetical protein